MHEHLLGAKLFSHRFFSLSRISLASTATRRCALVNGGAYKFPF